MGVDTGGLKVCMWIGNVLILQNAKGSKIVDTGSCWHLCDSCLFSTACKAIGYVLELQPSDNRCRSVLIERDNCELAAWVDIVRTFRHDEDTIYVKNTTNQFQ